MKKDIVVIRESIGRIVSMLTSQSIKVTQRGSRAYVSYHPKTGAIIGMNIPYLPDDASEEFISAVQGFLDHEVGHVLFSSSKTLIKANKLGGRVKNLANIIEDVFVERKMTEAFQGSATNLESVRKFYLEKIARVKIDEALAMGAVEEARGYATVAAFRAWGGQQTAEDFIAEPQIAKLVEPVKKMIGQDVLDMLVKCNSSDDCLELAVIIKNKLETPPSAPPAAPPAAAPPPPPPEESSEEEQDDESEKSPAPSATDMDSSPEKEEVDDKPEPGDVSDAPKDTKPTRTEKTESSEDSEKPDEDKPSDSPELEDAGITDDALGEPDSKGGSSAGKDSSEEKGDGGASRSDSEGGDIDDIDDIDDMDDIDDIDDIDGTKGESEPKEESLASMFDEERDFDKDVGESLSKEAKSELDSSSYVVFSKEWDSVVPAPFCDNVDSVERMHSSVLSGLGTMQKQLERAMAAKEKKAWLSGRPRGRISPGSLYKTSVGDDRVFRQRTFTKGKNTAVSLVIDCSGSMFGQNIRVAGAAAYAMASVLERLKITYEVIGFTTNRSSEMRKLMEIDAQASGSLVPKMKWARIEPLYMPVFKPFAGKLDTDAKSRIAHLCESPRWLCQNVDGECIQIAASRLLRQDAERRIMIVLSDGDPAAHCGRGLEAHLKTSVNEITKKGVQVIGVGILTRAVKSFYPNHVVLNDVEELPTSVMGELTKMLLAA